MSSSSYPYVPYSTTEIYYPRTKYRVRIDHTGKIVEEIKDKEEDKKKKKER